MELLVGTGDIAAAGGSEEDDRLAREAVGLDVRGTKRNVLRGIGEGCGAWD